MTQMTQEQLVEALENADSKEALESLGKQNLGIDVDKRRGIENIRMELLEKAEDGKPKSGSNETAQTEPAQEPASAALSTDIDAATEPAKVVTPTAESDPEEDAGEEEWPDDTPTETTRTLVNTKTGRRFAWTSALARLPHMREV